MLSKALREFTTGPLSQLIVNLGGQDGAEWEKQLKRFLRKEPCWSNGKDHQVVEPKPTRPILKFVGVVSIDATTCKFVARWKFVFLPTLNAPVKILHLGHNFTSWFLNGDGKTEDPESVQTLRYHKLRKYSGSGPIITELGGEAKAETTLSEMFSLMEKQKNGESGPLLNNGWWSIFYIRDQNGVLRTVRVHWDDDWHVNADPVECSRRWCGGNQVFSRDV